jgi:FMN phosphatase YigB (HAD superfamily)
VIVVTAEEHLAKPDPPLYRAAADRLAITPAEATFFDDWLESVEGARGMALLSCDEIVAQVSPRSGLRNVDLHKSAHCWCTVPRCSHS